MSSQKTALITGVNGMDGSHLADFLLNKGYVVYGMERRSSVKNRINTKHLESNDNFHFVIGDMSDSESLRNIVYLSHPDEVYNLAAQSFVGSSWAIPLETSDTNGLGVLRLLNAVKQYQEHNDKVVKFYQASTSEMFGLMEKGGSSANEQTVFLPRSPYGIAKLYAYWMVRNYRESYGLFACNGILFNHESERRGIEFVTRKISDAVARIHLGMQDKLLLGNLEVWRDWGYAPDYVEGMWLMLQQDTPSDYVLATNEAYSLEQFLDCAFKVVGLDWRDYVEQDERYMRPAEVPYLRGNYGLANDKLGWKPKTSFEELVEIMVNNDINLLRKD
jgi:GDPmannose 4,6-dehydratase|tara:strand:- start:12261 stop:13256 length:996 start_codon:yes stop_codon:yes gene_type:complete